MKTVEELKSKIVSTLLKHFAQGWFVGQHLIYISQYEWTVKSTHEVDKTDEPRNIYTILMRNRADKSTYSITIMDGQIVNIIKEQSVHNYGQAVGDEIFAKYPCVLRRKLDYKNYIVGQGLIRGFIE